MAKTTVMTTKLTRRRFIERLGLGAGAPLLAPIAATLFGEGQGWAQTGQRKRAVFFMIGDCLHYQYNFTPAEFSTTIDAPILDGPTAYSWPASFKALEPIRKRTMLIDGLSLQAKKSQHSAGYAALSNITALNDASNEYGGPPGGITIDQYVANTLGATTKAKSVLFGVNKYNSSQMCFASGANRPEAIYLDPKLMWTRLFGDLGGAANPVMNTGPTKAQVRSRFLLDSMRADITRMQKALSANERRKLDNYLQVIADYENRLKVQAPLSCKAPAQPGADVTEKTDKDVRLDLMFDMATLALACGMTNVVGVAAGAGRNSHQFMLWPNVGHNGEEGGKSAIATHNAMCARIMRMVGALEQVREGDRTAFDNSVILYTSDNGETHHSSKHRWPLVVIGNAGGKLRSDGRFMRYPAKGKAGWRSMADFYCSLAHAVGAPTDKFGDGGIEPVKGPLAEIMV